MPDFLNCPVFNLDAPRVSEWLQERSGSLITGIDDTTREAIQEILATAREEGWGMDQIASVLEDSFLFSEERADMIAQTELAYAYEAGSRMAIDDILAAGIEMEKSWLSADDDLVDEDCSDNESQGWIAVDDSFGSGDDEPPAHPNCRCTTLYQRSGAEEGQSETESSAEGGE